MKFAKMFGLLMYFASTTTFPYCIRILMRERGACSAATRFAREMELAKAAAVLLKDAILGRTKSICTGDNSRRSGTRIPPGCMKWSSLAYAKYI